MNLLLTLMMLSQAQSGHAKATNDSPPRQGTMPQGQGTGNMDTMQGANLSDEQKCQFECAREMRNCQMPCAPRTASDANDEKKRDAFMTCSKDCMKKSQPCFNSCQQKAGKKDKGKKKPEQPAAAQGAEQP